MKALVIGYGSIGKRHIANLSKIKKMEIIVCTKRKKDNFLKKIGCKLAPTIKEAISTKPDFAIICNETRFHLSTAQKLANAGIDFLAEKPLSHNLGGLSKLLKLVKKKKLITLMGCDLRFNPCIKKIKELVYNNSIGRIISAQIELGSYMPDWHPYEDYRKNYASINDLGGGVLLTCIHELDYLYWFLGKVNEVISITGKFSDLDIDVEDFSAILMKFKNNTIAEIHLDYFQKPTYRRCKLSGTKGTIYWDSDDNQVKIFDFKKNKWISKIKLAQNYNDNFAFQDELNHFLFCLNNNKSSINTIEDGARVLQIVDSIKKSSKIKKMVRVNETRNN